MSIEVKPGWYYLLFFATEACNEPFSGRRQDIIGAVYKEGGRDEPVPWQIRYRIRYYKDDKIWDSQDEKRWFGGQMAHDASTEEELIEKARQTIDGICSILPVEPDFNVIQGDSEAFMAVLRTKGYAHVRPMTDEEAREYENGESPRDTLEKRKEAGTRGAVDPRSGDWLNA